MKQNQLVINGDYTKFIDELKELIDAGWRVAQLEFVTLRGVVTGVAVLEVSE